MSQARRDPRIRVANSLRRGLVTIGAVGVLTLLATVVQPTSGSAATPATTRNSSGALLATLSDPAATAGDRFGFTVAVSGTTAVVGSPTSSASAGTTYIYDKGASGWPTTPTATLTDPAATADDEFGYSVAAAVTATDPIEAPDETTIIIGAPGTDSGAGETYIYVNTGSGWPTTPTATLTDPAAAKGDGFGDSVALSRFSGATAVVGAVDARSKAGAAYIYAKGDSGWPQTPTATLSDPRATSGDLFGVSVGASGTTVVVGASGTESGTGEAYVYLNNGSDWPTTPSVTLTDPAATVGDDFGYGVTVGGKNALVGASGTNGGAGAAYIYVNNGSGWPTAPSLTLTDPVATAGDSFGTSVAIQGTAAVVGATGTSSHAGAAYMYVEDASTWPTTPTNRWSDPAAAANDEFGYSVAVWGKAAVVGAIGTSSNAGAASIYRVPRNRAP